MGGAVHHHAVARAGLGLHGLDGGDVLVPGPGLVAAHRVGHPGLVEERLVDVQADGGEVAGQGQDLVVVVCDEEGFHHVLVGGDVAEVKQRVGPDRVEVARPGQGGQVAGLGAVAQLGHQVVVGNIDDLDGDAGLFLVFVGHRLVAAALGAVAGEHKLQGGGLIRAGAGGAAGQREDGYRAKSDKFRTSVHCSPEGCVVHGVGCTLFYQYD